MKKMELKAIFLDFDGVVLESANIKNEAFRRMFEPECPEKIDEIMDYLEVNSGLSRYVKFEYVYSNYLIRKLNEEEMKTLGKRFSEICLAEVEKAPFVDGVIGFLEKNKETMIVVASGSPDAELKDTVKKRGLEKYFYGVFGAPKQKSEIVEEVLGKLDLKKEDAVFIGDSMTDYEEAVKAGVPFIGRLSTEKSPFPEGIRVVKDFDELAQVLEER